jgi:hypothetical protein
VEASQRTLAWGHDSAGEGDGTMMVGALIGLSLMVTASVETGRAVPDSLPPNAMSMQQKNAVLRPLVRSATECILRSVTADPRFGDSMKSGVVGDLIVESMTPCLTQVRNMIDAYDRLFGDGSGEAFFMGPYLAVLPNVVTKQSKGAAAQ